MKKILILFLLPLYSVCLFAQNTRETRIFVQPVTGIGRQNDASNFYRLITNEITFHNYTLVNSMQLSDFIFRGSIRAYASEYLFTLELINRATEDIIGEQNLVYTFQSDSSINTLLINIVNNMLSVIPNMTDTNSWHNKWLFLDLSGLWMPRIYAYQQSSIYWKSFGVGLSAEFHFLEFMSFNAGIQFGTDWVVVSETTGEQYNDFILEFPMTFSYVSKPTESFIFEPYTGVSLNLSLTGSTKPSAFSWLVGIQFGIKAGPGMITINPRFSTDLSKSFLPYNNDNIPYNRYMVQIALGYKIGLFQKSQSDPIYY